jgi:superfamily I DNA/RNA helicase
MQTRIPRTKFKQSTASTTKSSDADIARYAAQAEKEASSQAAQTQAEENKLAQEVDRLENESLKEREAQDAELGIQPAPQGDPNELFEYDRKMRDYEFKKERYDEDKEQWDEEKALEASGGEPIQPKKPEMPQHKKKEVQEQPTQETEEESEEIINCFGYKPNQIVIQKIKDNLDKNKFPKKVNKNIPIKITTILGSKGLTSDYVFLVNFDDKYILDKGNKITDENICKFLVALTRAKRRIYIYTSQTKLPTFVDWISKGCIELN